MNEAFRKGVTYDNIKSNKRPVLYPLSRRCFFLKKMQEGWWWGQIDNLSFLRVKDFATIVWYFGNILVVKIKLMYFCKNELNDHFLKPTNS